MKKFLDNNLFSITNRHFKRNDGKHSDKKAVRVASEPSIYDIIQATKAEAKERPDDKGLKYALAQLHFFGRKNGYTAPASIVVSTINSSCSKMFPYSRVSSVLTAGIEKLSLKLDSKFLDRVAETIDNQNAYDDVVTKLELTDMQIKSVESRKYLSNKVNTLKGADTVNNLMYEIEELSDDSVKTSDSILENDSLLHAYKTPTNQYEGQWEKEAEFLNIIDFSSLPYEFESFDVRTAQYQILDSLSEQEWGSYLEKMSSAGVSVEYSEEYDTFNVTSFNKDAEDPAEPTKSKDTTKLEYEPSSKSPGGIKKKKVPGEEGKKEVEVITKLEGQAKESFTKIYKRTEQLRKLKDKQLEIQANLTAIKNSYTEEKESVSVELEGYLKFAESSFQKLGLFEEMAYALETSEGVILAAIKQTGKITVPEDPTKQIIPADATNILDRLKKMGKIHVILPAKFLRRINAIALKVLFSLH